jgi:hypothetical protein
VVAGLVAVLVAGPAVASARPSSAPGVDAATLLARVRSSDAVGWSGYGETRGDLVLPDVSQLGDLPELISGTTRMRAWWRSRTDYRVDQLTLVGERDVAVSAGQTWTWDSAARSATLISGDVGVRLPRAADLIAPALGARLSRSEAVDATRLPARRVAGVDAPGLRLRPQDPTTTTVGSVDLWAEPSTGLVLRVEVRARGRSAPALTSLLLDLDRTAPAPARTAFTPPVDASVDAVDAPDIAAAGNRFAPYVLPSTLAGLQRRVRVTGVGQGVGTYGEGFTVLTVVPLERSAAQGLLRSLLPQGSRESTASFSTEVVEGLVTRQRGRAYLLVGTVPQPLLQRALDELRASPPPRATS